MVGITTNDNGSVAEFSAIGYGKTAYIVSATVHGLPLVEKVEIWVSNLFITYDITNFNTDESTNQFVAELALSNRNGDETEITPAVVVYDNGVEVENVNLEFASSDENIAKIEGGAIIATGEGTAIFTATYEGNYISMVVNVYRPVIEIKDAIRIEQNNNEITLVSADLSEFIGAGEVSSVLFQGEEFNGLTYNNGTVSFDVASFGVNYGEQKVSFIVSNGSEEYSVEVPVLLITKVIRSLDELKAFKDLSKATEEKANLWGGYFELGADIDFGGSTWSFMNYESMTGIAKGEGWYDSKANGFNGVFDGCGYQIKNMGFNSWATGFIGWLHTDGVIRNIAFVGVQQPGGQSVVSAFVAGTIENIYVKYSWSGKGGTNDLTATFAGHVIEKSARIRDCLVIHSSGCDAENHLALGKYHIGEKTYDGVYVINPNNIAAAQSCNDGCTDAELNVWGSYTSREKMLENKAEWEDEVATWDTSFWAIDKDGMPMPRFEYNALASQQPEITNVETQIDAGATLTVTATPVGLVELTLDKKHKRNAERAKDLLKTLK